MEFDLCMLIIYSFYSTCAHLWDQKATFGHRLCLYSVVSTKVFPCQTALQPSGTYPKFSTASGALEWKRQKIKNKKMVLCFDQFGLCPENDNTKYNNVQFNSMKRKAGSENTLGGFSPIFVTCDKFRKHFVKWWGEWCFIVPWKAIRIYSTNAQLPTMDLSRWP